MSLRIHVNDPDFPLIEHYHTTCVLYLLNLDRVNLSLLFTAPHRKNYYVTGYVTVLQHFIQPVGIEVAVKFRLVPFEHQVPSPAMTYPPFAYEGTRRSYNDTRHNGVIETFEKNGTNGYDRSSSISFGPG